MEKKGVDIVCPNLFSLVSVTTLLQHQAQLGLNPAPRTPCSYLRQLWRGNVLRPFIRFSVCLLVD